MTIIVIGISFALIWLITTFFIFRHINKLKRDLLNNYSNTEKQPKKSKDISKGNTYKPFDSLKNYDPAYLLNFIQSEHPQIIALILAHMEPNKASIILQNLPMSNNMQSDISMRIATMDKVSHEITREIERVIDKKFSSMLNEDFTSAGGVESIVKILNNVDRASEKFIIDAMEKEDHYLAEEVKKRMPGTVTAT